MTDSISFGRPFVLRRDRDISGVAGTGIIADGILFPDGQAAIHWRGKWALTTPHPDGMDSILAIHDHGGQGDLHVIWADHDELRQKVLADVVEAFDVPPEVCGTAAETAYLKTQIRLAVDGAWQAGATTHQWAERTRAEIVDAVMPFVGRLQDQRDGRLRAIGRAYRLAYTWQGAYGSANILVRAAGAELCDALDESGVAPSEVVHPVSNEQISGLPGVDYPAAAECSAQHHGFDDRRQCIRAAQHRGDHIDERGFHWSDAVAVYPIVDAFGYAEKRPAQGADKSHCVCGDPIEQTGDPAEWIHSPGSDTPCLDARPALNRCGHRGPHPGLTCAEVDASQPYFRVRWEQEQQAPAADEDARPLGSPAWRPGDGYARCPRVVAGLQCVFRAGHPPHGCTGSTSNPGTRDQLPPNQGPLTGIEVRDPCPYCEGCPLIPRHLMDDHIRGQHPDVTLASHANGSRAGTEGTEPAPCDAYEPPADPADTGFCARCGMFDHQHPSRLRVGGPGIPVPPAESEGAGLTPRQRAYKAVNEYMPTLGWASLATRTHIWRAVNRALDAAGHPADPETQCRLPHEMEV
ncbi:hypothetical protein [Streptomyces chartreusis]|uniref:hypothetical protein n=1 Tax=Streptomyces chartreusis TaxID=1969 RepID=UPI00381EEB49